MGKTEVGAACLSRLSEAAAALEVEAAAELMLYVLRELTRRDGEMRGKPGDRGSNRNAAKENVDIALCYATFLYVCMCVYL